MRTSHCGPPSSTKNSLWVQVSILPMMSCPLATCPSPQVVISRVMVFGRGFLGLI